MSSSHPFNHFQYYKCAINSLNIKYLITPDHVTLSPFLYYSCTRIEKICICKIKLIAFKACVSVFAGSAVHDSCGKRKGVVVLLSQWEAVRWGSGTLTCLYFFQNLSLSSWTYLCFRLLSSNSSNSGPEKTTVLQEEIFLPKRTFSNLNIFQGHGAGILCHQLNQYSSSAEN